MRSPSFFSYLPVAVCRPHQTVYRLYASGQPDNESPQMPRASSHRRAEIIFRLGVFLLVLSLPSLCGAQQPTREQLELLKKLPDNAHVLYILGDLNGDGVVDQKDLALLREIVAKPSAPMPAAVRCQAAGDLNLDRKLDASDVTMLAGWLKDAPRVSIPALYWQTGLGCKLSEPYLAATIEPRAGDNFLIRFIDPRYSTSNVRVVVHSGPATIRPAADGKGYSGTISSDAKSGALAILLITLPRNRSYYYDLQVRAAPH